MKKCIALKNVESNTTFFKAEHCFYSTIGTTTLNVMLRPML